MIVVPLEVVAGGQLSARARLVGGVGIARIALGDDDVGLYVACIVEGGPIAWAQVRHLRSDGAVALLARVMAEAVKDRAVVDAVTEPGFADQLVTRTVELLRAGRTPASSPARDLAAAADLARGHGV